MANQTIVTYLDGSTREFSIIGKISEGSLGILVNAKSIVIGDTVTGIDDDAFRECDALVTVVMSNRLKSIGNRAFIWCSNINNIVIPDSVTHLGELAFRGCANLTSITISNSITSISDSIFSQCIRLTHITIPDGVTSIGNEAFFGCSSLTSITIPDSVTSISDSAFRKCNGLANENGFIIIRDTLYGYTGNETSITIPSGVTRIGYYTFFDDVNTVNIIIPNSVTSIGSGAFGNCTSLTNITIPDSVTNIGSWAFYECIGFTNVTIPINVTNIGYNAFSQCSNLTLHFQDRTIDDVTSMSYYSWGLTPDQIQVDEPSSSKTIVTFTNNEISSFEVNGALTQEIIQNWETQSGSQVQAVQVGTGVTSIGELAFQNCTNLTSVTIPNLVKSIGGYAFSNSGLTNVTIPNSVESIGEGAFNRCSGLTSVIIPNSVTSIGEWAFDSCNNAILKFLDRTYDDVAQMDNHYWGLPNGVNQIRANELPPIQEYTITLDKQGGSGGSTYVQVEYNETLPTISTPTKANYSFNGYYSSANGQGVQYYYANGASARLYDKTSDITLYAYWVSGQHNEITITFDANGGIPATQTKTIVEGQPIGNLLFASKSGYTFVGWFTQVDGGAYINSSTIFSNDTTVYAHWEKDQPSPVMPLYLYDDVKLSIVKNLNTRILNQSFVKLAKNDIGIFPINDYIPKTWENRWFNDDAIAGYDKGDVVWKGVMTFTSFLSNYATLIQKYANENALLSDYFEKPASEFYNEIPKYQNVVSGYQVSSNISGTTTWSQVLPMMFDPGNIQLTSSYSIPNTKLSIYISLHNDNKEMLSNSFAWKPIALTSEAMFEQYIKTELQLMFDEHVANYHLGGSKLSSEFDDVLLRNDFSNFSNDALYGAPQVRSHHTYFNAQGVDYVVQFAKAPVPWSLSSQYSLYRWFRLWNSGYLEHGGFVEIPAVCGIISSSQVSDYVAKVDLEWTYGDISAISYDYPTIYSNAAYGNMHKRLYFRRGVEQIINEDERILGPEKRYSISLTPVDFQQSYVKYDQELSTYSYDSISSISSLDFLQPQVESINDTYLDYEVHLMKNNSFCIARNLIDNGMLSSTHANIVQYYVSGYRSSIKRSYDMSKCIIVGLEKTYAYTGNEVNPSNFVVKANDGLTLLEGIDYWVDYGDLDLSVYNVGPGDDTGKVTIYGIDPYRGSLSQMFSIKKPLDGYMISGVASEYEYE